MIFSVKLQNDDLLKKKLTMLVAATQKRVKQIVHKATVGTRADAKKACPVAFGRLKASIKEEWQDGGMIGIVSVGNKYGKWVEGVYHNYTKGRASGKWPPHIPILLWVIKKQIHVKWFGKSGPKTARMATYLVRRKIGSKGTPAQPFFAPAVAERSRVFQEECSQVYIQVGRQVGLAMEMASR